MINTFIKFNCFNIYLGYFGFNYLVFWVRLFQFTFMNHTFKKIQLRIFFRE
jgi:hypothetical protein